MTARTTRRSTRLEAPVGSAISGATMEVDAKQDVVVKHQPSPSHATPTTRAANTNHRKVVHANKNQPTPTIGPKPNKANVGATNKARQTAQTTNNRLSIIVDATTEQQRPPRERKPRTAYSPSDHLAPTRAYRRRQEPLLGARGLDADPLSAEDTCRRLEARVRSQVKQLRYLLTFLEAYEAEGWRRASREKLKPSKELDAARRKVAKTKRIVVDSLLEMQTLRQRDPPIPYLVELDAQPPSTGGEGKTEEGEGANAHAERIYCSRCSKTETSEDNDILLCDNEGCFRAFHQRCQSPFVRTEEIPEGDEPWFCGSCLSIFNALKTINNACETSYEQISDVISDLSEDEHALSGHDHSNGEPAGGDDDDDDEEDDEEFALADDDHQNSDSDESMQSNSDPREDAAATSGEDGILESDVSEDELKHLHDDDVIDPNRRSMRSQAGTRGSKRSPREARGVLGQRVAKQSDDGQVVFGVVVERQDDDGDHQALWRVVYYDDTMDLLSDANVKESIVFAAQHHQNDTEEAAAAVTGADDVDQSLILRGKRKRSRVDYRALNDLMFGGKEDSDAGGESHDENGGGSDYDDEDQDATTNGHDGGDGDGDDDDDDFTATSPSGPATSQQDGAPKRGKRERRSIDYRAMHEGVVSF